MGSIAFASFSVPLSVVLIVLFVMERIVHAILWLFLAPRVTGVSSTSGNDAAAGLAARGVVGGLVHIYATLVTALVTLVTSTMTLISSFLIWFLVVFVCLSLLWVTYEEYPGVWLHALSFYNARLGPGIHTYLFVPMQFLSVFVKAVVPIYNGVVYILTYLVTHGLLPLMWDQASAFGEISLGVLNLAKATAVSMKSYVEVSTCAASNDCKLTSSTDLDLLTPMESVRAVTLAGVSLFDNVCGLLGVHAQLLAYPLLDPRFATAAHNLVNAALHLFVQIPIATARRSREASLGSGLSVLRNTPDFEPFWTRLAGAMRDLGDGVDNWLAFGVSLAMSDTGLGEDLTDLGDGAPRRRLMSTTSGVGGTCTDSAWMRLGENGTGLPSTGAEHVLNSGALTGATAVVGLTDGLMAVSNGTVATFYSHASNVTVSAAWPIPVDVTFGLAAVTHADAGSAETLDLSTHARVSSRAGSRYATAVLGCNCRDSSDGIQVTCAILPYAPGGTAVASHVFDVYFQDTVWRKDFRCDLVELSVRSVRWPVTRYEGTTTPFAGSATDVPNHDCISRATCESVDATIWLVPKCGTGVSGMSPVLCDTIQVAVGTTCFPYCMATRLAGTLNRSPVFVGARAWQTGKQLLGMDCVGLAEGASEATVQSAQQALLASVRREASALFSGAMALLPGGSPLAVSSPAILQTLGCTPVRPTGVSVAESWVPDDTVSVPYVRARSQPFAITGDTLLLPMQEPGAGQQRVLVERLTGNQRDVYSLKPGPVTLPGVPRPVDMTPAMLAAAGSASPDAVLVPFAFQESRIHATSSRNYLFYAMQPPYGVLRAYHEYCAGGDVPQFQLMILSSYTPLVVYRVRAYCQVDCERDMSASFVFNNFATDGLDAKALVCDRRFNATVVSMDYVDEENVAIVLQECDSRLNLTTASPTCMHNPVFATYWLHPATMQVRRGSPWATAARALPVGSLGCAPAATVPRLGTMVARMGMAGMYGVRFGLDAVTYAPGMISLWTHGGKCGTDSQGHSVIAACGGGYLDLDDMFDAVRDASHVMWNIPRWGATVLRSNGVGGGRISNPLLSWLQGSSAMGTATGTPPTGNLQADAGRVLSPDVMGHVMGVVDAVRTQSIWNAGSSATTLAIIGPRFGYHVVRHMVTDTGQRLLDPSSSSDPSAYSAALGTMYDTRLEWNDVVLPVGRDACEGLSILMGGSTSPWARLLKHSCLNGLLLADGAYAFLLSVFVDIPLIKCVCRDARGGDAIAYARSKCVPFVPTPVRPVVLAMISAAEADVAGGRPICASVVNYTRETMISSMTPWFENTYDGMDALGSSVDYLLKSFDNEAGECLSFDHNPNVVVIVPEPVDYFQACGRTTSCRSKCMDEWTAFSTAQSAYASASLSGNRTTIRAIQSKFFPAPEGAVAAPGNVLALTEVPTDERALCNVMCRFHNDRCFAAVLGTTQGLEVRYFCIPLDPTASVYDGDGQYDWVLSTAPSDVTALGFVTANGSSVALLRPYQGGSVVLLEARGVSSPTAVLNISYANPFWNVFSGSLTC